MKKQFGHKSKIAKINSVKNLKLETTDDGCWCLKAQEISGKLKKTYEVDFFANKIIRCVGSEVIEENVKELSFPLKKVSKAELKQKRKKKIPSFVYKRGEELWWAEIPTMISMVSMRLLNTHLCAGSTKACEHLSAAPDEEGGCAKVRARSTGIENFDFIEEGYETFGTQNDCFVVVRCTHHEESKPKKALKPDEVRRLKLALAQQLYPDIEYIGQVRRNIHRK